jgi:hypothetical protein
VIAERDRAGRRRIEPDDKPRDGRLAAAGFADEADAAALRHLEREVVHRTQIALRLALDEAVEERRGDVEFLGQALHRQGDIEIFHQFVPPE